LSATTEAQNGDQRPRRVAPIAPDLQGPSFVPWLADHQAALLDSLDREVVGAVASSLHHASRNSAALIRARGELGLGLMFDLEDWRIQLPLDHPKRKPLQALGLDTERVYRPDDHVVSEEAARRRAAAALGAQTAAVNPTIFTTPAHWLSHSQTGRGRENELRIMRATVELFHDRALDQPAPGDARARRRGLFGTILIDVGRLTGPDISWILEAHDEIEVDGFLVWIVNFNKGLSQARAADELLHGLQARSLRPVVGGGLSHFHVAELARGLAATCSGPQRSEYRLPPAEAPVPTGDEDPPGRAIHVYHGAVLGCFGLSEADAARRRQAFLRFPCPCGHHRPQQPPDTYEEIVAHNAYWLSREAADALRGPAAAALLAARVPTTRETRRSLGMGRLSACWSLLAEPGQRAATG
jgi:hypothetical protein